MIVQATPYNAASEVALEIYGEVLKAVRADRLVERAMRRVGDQLFIQDLHIDLSQFKRVWIAGAGKASAAMARAAELILGDKVAGGLVVTKEVPRLDPQSKLEILEAAHPVPDLTSLVAGSRMIEFAHQLGEDDLVVFMLSGGASSLMESTREGVSLDDIQALNRWALASGINIGEINRLRSRLSKIKGGGLAHEFFPATVAVVALSDVVGNDLGTIGSGPFLKPTLPIKTVSSAVRPPHGLLSRPSEDYLSESDNALSTYESKLISHHVVGSISLAIHEAVDATRKLGLEPLPFGNPIKGEARVAARELCRFAKDRLPANSCMIFGGEAVVTLRGTGVGGRCQEMAVSAADILSKMPNACFLAGSTDGGDGPTEFAGGLVDENSVRRARLIGLSTRSALSRNASQDFLRACGGLLYTGVTDSNVNDLVLIVHKG